jgi:8-oxo-dGTP diphosphatase
VLVVGAILRHGPDVLLVRERLPNGSEGRWAIPGGMVEPGELLPDAIGREVREETGLLVGAVGEILLVSQHYHPDHTDSLIQVTFDIPEFSGELQPNDPDGLVTEAAFFSTAEAVEMILRDPFGPSSLPIASVIQGGAGAPSAGWFWRLSESAEQPAIVTPPSARGGLRVR